MSRLRESSLIDGITAHQSSQQEFCNGIETILTKSGEDRRCRIDMAQIGTAGPKK
jgi:hypothetical protein